MSDQTPRRREITYEDRAVVAEAIAELARARERNPDKPLPLHHNPAKFTDPIGLDDEGNYQQSLTPEERAHLTDIKRRARGE